MRKMWTPARGSAPPRCSIEDYILPTPQESNSLKHDMKTTHTTPAPCRTLPTSERVRFDPLKHNMKNDTLFRRETHHPFIPAGDAPPLHSGGRRTTPSFRRETHHPFIPAGDAPPPHSGGRRTTTPILEDGFLFERGNGPRSFEFVVQLAPLALCRKSYGPLRNEQPARPRKAPPSRKLQRRTSTPPVSTAAPAQPHDSPVILPRECLAACILEDGFLLDRSPVI
jgi:hypothetical protein